MAQGLVETNASTEQLQFIVMNMTSIHQQLIDSFSQSGGARVAMYQIFRGKMKMDGILFYTQGVILGLSSIIENRKTSGI